MPRPPRNSRTPSQPTVTICGQRQVKTTAINDSTQHDRHGTTVKDHNNPLAQTQEPGARRAASPSLSGDLGTLGNHRRMNHHHHHHQAVGARDPPTLAFVSPLITITRGRLSSLPPSEEGNKGPLPRTDTPGVLRGDSPPHYAQNDTKTLPPVTLTPSTVGGPVPKHVIQLMKTLPLLRPTLV